MDTGAHRSRIQKTHTKPYDATKIGYPQEHQCIDKIIRYSTSEEPFPCTSKIALQNIKNLITLEDQEAVQYDSELEDQLDKEEEQILDKWEILTKKALQTISTVISNLQLLMEKELERAGEANLNNTKTNNLSIIDATESCDNEMVIIGPNGTEISRKVLNRIDWSMSGKKITQTIVSEIFGHKTLASSSLTGEPSKSSVPDPLKEEDVVFFLKTKANMPETLIRMIIFMKLSEGSEGNEYDDTNSK